MNKNININICHSIIIDYPINYNNFPLAKNEEIFKVELNKNDFLTIPEGWFHWVYTDPNTVSISYQIPYIDFKDFDNPFYNSFKFSNPYKGTKIIDINYNDFINSTQNDYYFSVISETNDCSPVVKNDKLKFVYENTLSNIIENYKNNYMYIGNNKLKTESIVFKYKKINTLIDEKFYNNVMYKTSVWFSFDKTINSGLHFDDTNNIIFVLDGRKTVYLLNPKSKPNLYVKDMFEINDL